MGNQAKILMVDDEPANLRIMSEHLGEKYQLASASDGTQALLAVSQFNPALVLLDVKMPGLTGPEVCVQLKSSAVHAHIRIILVTGHPDDLAQQISQSAGADGYVTKPFREQELLIAIAQALS